MNNPTINSDHTNADTDNVVFKTEGDDQWNGDRIDKDMFKSICGAGFTPLAGGGDQRGLRHRLARARGSMIPYAAS